MDIERQNFIPEQKKEVCHEKWAKVSDSPNKRKPINMDELRENLLNHLGVLKEEVKQNGGIPPAHRLREIDGFIGC